MSEVEKTEKIVELSESEYNFDLDQYSGPLDLLLHLSRTKEITISELKINELIDQYIIFIQTVEEGNITIAASYLEMLAELVRIKAKQLLFEEDEEYEEEELTSEELIRRLIRYKKYKEVSYVLYDMRARRNGMYSKSKSNMRQFKENVNKENISMDDIAAILKAFYITQEKQKREEKKIDHNEIRIEDVMHEVKAGIGTEQSLYNLLKGKEKLDIVITLLSILELAKRGEIELVLDQSEIMIKGEGAVYE